MSLLELHFKKFGFTSEKCFFDDLKEEIISFQSYVFLDE